jgi:hypothetical protein
LLQKLGIKIGHYTDKENLTGLTVFIAEEGADLGIDIHGSNTGTFNTPCFDPKAAWSEVHAVALTCGSTFGLSSAVSAMKSLSNYIAYFSLYFRRDDGLVIAGNTDYHLQRSPRKGAHPKDGRFFLATSWDDSNSDCQWRLAALAREGPCSQKYVSLP